ncbi:MAG: site-2 protease family protein [Vampirovibrio sp.]|nr:site-2 protease family protein [Vampirovibrio sp.]
MFIESLFTDPQYYFWVILIVMFSVCLHELFHALAASWEGDDTAKDAGYFTMNPLVHMGKESLVILALFGFCWGLTPVNPSRFRHRYGEALVAFAGPFANLLLLVVFSAGAVYLLLSGALASQPSVEDNVFRFLQIGAVFNAFLFLFNLIPVPPLDGFTVLADIVPATRSWQQGFLGRYGFIVIIGLFWLGLGSIFFGQARAMVGTTFKILAMVMGG